MKNNNQKIVAHLAKKEYNADRRRSMVLTGAVAFAVMALFSVFSFASGKIETDMLRSAREKGVVVDTTLERATQEQYEQILELPYIKDVGKYVKFGYALGTRCAVIDSVAWEKIKKPAFTDIHGTYPKEEKEIMLSMRALKMAGIEEPKIGMELPVSIEFVDDSENQEEFCFRLSGYYTEYIATIIYGPPDSYFSQAFLDSVSDGREWDMKLLMRQDDRMRGRRVENQLYNDIAMRDVRQQFLGDDTSLERAAFAFAGGFDTVFVLAAVILLCAGLLIYNVLHISLEQRIREYGLLKTLGATKKQLRAIMFWQTARTVFWGSAFGAAAGALIALFALPMLLSGLYLYRIGSAAGMITFRPLLLAAAVFFTGCVAFLCSAIAVRRTVGLSPTQAVYYMETAFAPKSNFQTRSRKAERRQKKSRSGLPRMAWRNIMRFKKRYFVSIACLTLGLIVSLGVTMMMGGADTVNQIEHDISDISVSTWISGSDYNRVALGTHRKNEDGIIPLIPDEFLDMIQSRPGIMKSEIARGGFGEVLWDAKALSILHEELEGDPCLPYRAICTMQILDDGYLEELKTFAKEKGLMIDVDSVIRGEGMIQMHGHQLSPAQIELSRDKIGKKFGVYDIVSKKKARNMSFCGYLDFEEEGLPEFHSTVYYSQCVYFLISEKGFENLNTKEQTFGIEITAKPGWRATLTEEIRQLVDEYNSQFALLDHEDYWLNDDELALSFYSKIDAFEEMRDYIVSNRLLMGALCAVLLLMGIVNYINVTITGLTVRRKEFAVMESIGFTRRQLRKMLVFEGMFYSFMILALTGVFGSGIYYLLGKYMERRMRYFSSSYPVAEFLVCAAGLLLSCVLIVLLLYRKYAKSSVALRLRIYAD